LTRFWHGELSERTLFDLPISDGKIQDVPQKLQVMLDGFRKITTWVNISQAHSFLIFIPQEPNPVILQFPQAVI